MELRKRSPIVVAVALAMMIVVALTAVGAGASNQSANSSLHTIKVGAGPWTIGLSNGYYGNGARVQLEAEVKALAAQQPYKSLVKKVIYNNAGTSVAAQISAVDQMIAQHVDAIILDSNSVTGLNPAIAAAHKAGIPVVASNDKVSSPLAYQVETVGKSFGATMMSALREGAGGQGQHHHPPRPRGECSRCGRGGRVPQRPQEVPQHQGAQGDPGRLGRQHGAEGDGRPPVAVPEHRRRLHRRRDAAGCRPCIPGCAPELRPRVGHG